MDEQSQKPYAGAFQKAVQELEQRCMDNGLDPVDVVRSMLEALPDRSGK